RGNSTFFRQRFAWLGTRNREFHNVDLLGRNRGVGKDSEHLSKLAKHVLDQLHCRALHRTVRIDCESDVVDVLSLGSSPLDGYLLVFCPGKTSAELVRNNVFRCGASDELANLLPNWGSRGYRGVFG